MLKLDDNYGVTADRHCFALKEISEGQTKDGETVERVKVLGYFGTLARALQFYANHRLKRALDADQSAEELIGFLEVLFGEVQDIAEGLEAELGRKPAELRQELLDRQVAAVSDADGGGTAIKVPYANAMADAFHRAGEP